MQHGAQRFRRGLRRRGALPPDESRGARCAPADDVAADILAAEAKGRLTATPVLDLRALAQ
jgi:hypothetical protein